MNGIEYGLNILMSVMIPALATVVGERFLNIYQGDISYLNFIIIRNRIKTYLYLYKKEHHLYFLSILRHPVRYYLKWVLKSLVLKQVFFTIIFIFLGEILEMMKYFYNNIFFKYSDNLFLFLIIIFIIVNFRLFYEKLIFNSNTFIPINFRKRTYHIIAHIKNKSYYIISSLQNDSYLVQDYFQLVRNSKYYEILLPDKSILDVVNFYNTSMINIDSKYKRLKEFSLDIIYLLQFLFIIIISLYVCLLLYFIIRFIF